MSEQLDNDQSLPDERDSMIAELRIELARAEAAAEMARQVAAADVRAAQAEVQVKDQVIAELKAMLTEACKPWWRWFIR